MALPGKAVTSRFAENPARPPGQPRFRTCLKIVGSGAAHPAIHGCTSPASMTHEWLLRAHIATRAEIK
jgi:hypothetical protein